MAIGRAQMARQLRPGLGSGRRRVIKAKYGKKIKSHSKKVKK
tara:strand:+ start:979 stop:1104 length:126 start_codon:yes stop_codon:yes gene_type:complete